MDLDSFEKDFRKFKARVEPMLKEYEARKAEEGSAEADALHDAVHAPLAKPDGTAPAPAA